MGTVGGLLWTLSRFTNRHRQLQAELTRLERLSAEVAMHAEAVLDQVDERIAELQRLAALTQAPAPVPAEPKAEVPAQLPAQPSAQAVVQAPVQAPAPAPAPPAPTVVAAPTEPAGDRYQRLQAEVLALAARGKSESDIARELGVPRGEVQLMLRLRHTKAARVG
jgi:type IV secretory pathway VirB10-like protein